MSPKETTMHTIRFVAPIALLIACAPVQQSPSPVIPVATSIAAPVPPRDIHWFRNGAEMRAIYIEVYRAASEQLEKLATGVAPQTWAVILDADETVLDNSTEQKRSSDGHEVFSDSAWARWVHKEAAPALPGAVAFTRLVHQLGGKVVIVTNRSDAFCDATRRNLQRDSVDAEMVLCRTASGDKNVRFSAVQNGTPPSTLRALKVLMWLGDNIQDFPNQTQSLRDRTDIDYSDFGRIYFVFPNPMYGSWERVPYR